MTDLQSARAALGFVIFMWGIFIGAILGVWLSA